MKGVRERFTDRLDYFERRLHDFELTLRTAMDQMEKANRDLVLSQASTSKTIVTIIDELIPPLERLKYLHDESATLEYFEIRWRKAQAEEIERYLSLPWYRRLFVRAPRVSNDYD